MQHPQALRDLAKRCRRRANVSLEREVVEQLYLWARELANAANQIEQSAAQQREVIRFGKWIS